MSPRSPVPACAPAAAPGWSAERLAAQLDVLENQRDRDVEEVLAEGVALQRAAEAIPDPALARRAELLQADMLDRLGETQRAVRMLWAVHGWAAERDCRPVLARSHLLLSRTHHNLGDMSACLEHAVSAVEYLGEDAPPDRRAHYVAKLADALGWAGSFDAARERYRQAERLAVAAGNPEREMMVLNNLAYTEYEAGEFNAAWTVVERMFAFRDRTGREFDGNDLDTISRIQLALGRHADAEKTVLQAIATYGHMRNREADCMAEYLLTLATARRGLGALYGAQASLDHGLALCEERALGDVRVRVLQEQAELYAAAGDYRRAFATYKAFHRAEEAQRSAQQEAQARTRQAIFETTEARQHAERFREQARTDPLTGLPNRRYVDEELPFVLARAEAAGVPVTVALADLDHFKRINDTLSHDVGDRVLATVGELLRAGLRTDGFVARLGGEEFLVVLPGLGASQAEYRLDVLRNGIRAHDWVPLTGELPVTVSIGAVCLAPGDRAGQAELLGAADHNLYAAKRCGRDRVVADTFVVR